MATELPERFSNPRAVPLDVLEVKQAQLDELKAVDSQLASAMGDVETGEQGNDASQPTAFTALPSAYRKAGPLFRCQMNQAYFVKVFINQGGVTGCVLTPEYEAITRPGSTGRGLVEPAGLEPATSALQRRRSSS
jgi:hypothetical protein